MRLLIPGIALCLLAHGGVSCADEAGTTLAELYLTVLLAPGSAPEPAAELGRALAARGSAGADKLTVSSELYWRAFFSVGWDDPRIYLARIQLLMLEGRLEQAANTLSFAAPSALKRYASWESSIEWFWAELMERFEEYDRTWSRGARLLDRGKFDEALACFDRVLAENPSYCPALVSKAAALSKMETQGHPGGSKERALALLAEARASNPFYAWAYQGVPGWEKIGAVAQLLHDDVATVRTGDARSVDLTRFAEGCRIIKAPDYGIYALWVDIGQKFAAGSPVQEEIRKVAELLEEKGMVAAASFFDDTMTRILASR